VLLGSRSGVVICTAAVDGIDAGIFELPSKFLYKLVFSFGQELSNIRNTVEAVWSGQNIMERSGDLLTVAALFYHEP
jgi:hypothetical protein